MSRIAIAICLAALIPAARASAQDFDVSLETVRSWDIASGDLAGLPAAGAQAAAAEPQTVTTTWTDTGGLSHSVTTERKRHETAADWAERHAAAVEAFQEVFPPEPQ